MIELGRSTVRAKRNLLLSESVVASSIPCVGTRMSHVINHNFFTIAYLAKKGNMSFILLVKSEKRDKRKGSGHFVSTANVQPSRHSDERVKGETNFCIQPTENLRCFEKRLLVTRNNTVHQLLGVCPDGRIQNLPIFFNDLLLAQIT